MLNRMISILTMLSLLLVLGCYEYRTELKKLDSVIDLVKAQPGEVVNILTTAIDDFSEMETDLSQKISEDLSDILDDMLDMPVETDLTGRLCAIDMTIDMVIPSLQAIKHDINPNRFPMPEFEPSVCNANPHPISFSMLPEIGVIEYAGYNFTNYLKNNGDYYAFIEDGYTGEIILSSIPVNLVSNVVLQINTDVIESLDLDTDQAPRLVLRADDSDQTEGYLLSSISILE